MLYYINAHYTNKLFTSPRAATPILYTSPRAATPLDYAIQKQCLRFYLPLCNRTPFYPPNPLCINTLYWLQILRFICNHLQPSATDATLVSAVLWNGELLLAEQAIRIYNRRYSLRTSYCYMVNVSAMLVYIHQKKYRSSFYS